MTGVQTCALPICRTFLLRQLFRKLGVQLGQLARLFEDRLLEFLVIQLGKGARSAVLVPLDDLPGNLRFPHRSGHRGIRLLQAHRENASVFQFLQDALCRYLCFPGANGLIKALT